MDPLIKYWKRGKRLKTRTLTSWSVKRTYIQKGQFVSLNTKEKNRRQDCYELIHALFSILLSHLVLYISQLVFHDLGSCLSRSQACKNVFAQFSHFARLSLTQICWFETVWCLSFLHSVLPPPVCVMVTLWIIATAERMARQTDSLWTACCQHLVPARTIVPSQPTC